MATTTNSSEWDDIPTSSELFGGDFFGDELMEMYTADHGLNLGDNSASVITTSSTSDGGVAGAAVAAVPGAAEDEAKHPGLLIAMNAAAMDGGLSPLGTSPEFVPLAAPSDTSLPPYPMGTPEPAPVMAAAPPAPLAAAPLAAAPTPAPLAPAAAPAAPIVPAPVTSAPALAAAAPPVANNIASAVAAAAPKRPAMAAAIPAQALKKAKVAIAAPLAPAGVPPKAAIAAPVIRAHAAVPARLAASGGIKAAILPATTRPIGRVISSSIVPQNLVKAPLAAVARPSIGATMVKNPTIPATTTHAAVVPRSRMPVGGGINHQVIARPSMVTSAPGVAVASQRILVPAPSQTAKAAAMRVAAPVLPVSSTGVQRAKSEADFKDVATAAVSSLIQNASSSLKTGPKPMVPMGKPGDKTVDTSTAHINALTSQNWVTACNPVPTPDVSVSSGSACDKAARNARRATLTQEERAKQNRDRNREHARNTRLRKKAYVEELKRTLTELVAQRDAADLEKRHEAQRNREQREVRFRVMEEFLKLRGRNEMNAARWVAILEEGFTFTLPKTLFRRMVDTDKSVTDVNGGSAGLSNSSHEQTLRGASVCMEDSQHLSAFLQTVGGPASAATQVQIVYRCDRKRFFMDGNVAFMDFTANTHGAVAKGATHEAVFRGSMRSSFSPASNKLISVDISFDTAAIVHQVEAMGGVSPDAAAAAANEADALLDSLQMPQIFVDNKDVAVAHAAAAAAGPVSVSSDDGDRSTDGSPALHNA